MPHSSTNRLASETSPYLLQHAHNPVDWYPWAPEAIARAKREDRPIFLSIGYSACHWCHVMERECFENEAIAAMMNEHFVNVKVDREERPDLDQIYMTAVQAMTGQGGWPMSVFLTPDLQPFYGGTYFPPTDSRGMPGFPRVLLSVHQAWRDRRDEIMTSAVEMTKRLRLMGEASMGTGALDRDLLSSASMSLLRSFDPKEGGFGSAPKFPHPMDLRVLLRFAAWTGEEKALNAVRLTLDKMSRGGIYDHLGGGFARYSTDARWLAPHFEKMLYDNALLSTAYLEAFQLTKDDNYAQVVVETFQYVLTRMTDLEGAFYSTEDADSEGVEGKYYVWTLDELTRILGTERANTFARVYDVTVSGNWEGHNILNLPRPLAEAATILGRDLEELRAELVIDRAKLLEVREGRIPPAKDTKILTSWNGLMIAALAEGSRILKDELYLRAAEKAASFLLDRMRADDGKLLHGFKDGRARFNAYLDDYTNLIDGLTRLYEVSGNLRWLRASLDLANLMIAEFGDPVGGFYYTGESHEKLISRTKDVHDNATPSGNAMAATALLRLAALTDRKDLREKGEGTLQLLQPVMERVPSAGGQALIALSREVLPSAPEIAIVSGTDPGDFRKAIEAVYTDFLPGKVVAPATFDVDSEYISFIPWLAERPSMQGRVTTYVCEAKTCQPPVLGVEEIGEILSGLRRSGDKE